MEVRTIQPEIQIDEQALFSTVFKTVMWWKILYGVCKVVFALALIKWVVLDPSNIFFRLMTSELTEDPNDLFIKLVKPLMEHTTTSSTTFFAIYLLFWGIVDDIFLSINILRDKMWAFPVALTLIALFVPYEIYRFVHTHSLILVGVIAFDIVLFAIITNEYRKQRALTANAHKN